MEQYELMLDIYDKVVEELKVMKKALEEAATSPKAEWHGHTHKVGYALIIWFIRQKIKALCALNEALELTVDTTEPQTMNEAMLMYANKNKANMFIGF